MPKTNAKSKTKTKTSSNASKTRSAKPPAFRLRRSPVHGSGLFAARTIAKGERIVEYVGERISQKEADRRHALKDAEDGHTFLFTIDARTVIDAGVGGNDSRFINHSCAPSCEVYNVDGRLFVEALRVIEKGEELAYDYNLTRDSDDTAESERIFACRCGAAECRGSMLAPPKKSKAKSASKAKSKSKSKSNGASKTKPKGASKTKSKPSSATKTKTKPKATPRKAAGRAA